MYRGKVQVLPKCPVRSAEDWAVWYTPGVAAPCRAIAEHPELVYEHTNKGNSIAIVSDGTRVLGLGDIGPEAGLPVMEGKALLFKYLGGIDAVPLCVRTTGADELVRVVEALEPSFGAINLEDIAQPKCFRVLDALRESLRIPVWHDDQQGTAAALLAGLINALKLVGKKIADVRIVLVGIGAANHAVYRLLKTAGVSPGAIIACDSKGTLHADRLDIEGRRNEFSEKWAVCLGTNADGVKGGVADALVGADVCIAFSSAGPGIIRPEWVRRLAGDAIVFACANPVPEIWPWEAREAGARVVATGRSDFPNQLNNSLVFPGLFRGVLDVRARRITDVMAIAAATELAACAEEAGLRDERILPTMADWRVPVRVAVATGLAAQGEGVASLTLTAGQLEAAARKAIENARQSSEALLRAGVIAPPPDDIVRTR
jgi:malate dehydrogenase (oxaloacetate-decarboxylating)